MEMEYSKEPLAPQFELPEITEKWTFTEFEQYGNYITANQQLIKSERDAQYLANICKNNVPYALLGILTIPPQLEPRGILELHEVCMTHIKHIPTKYHFAMEMKRVEAALRLFRGESLLEQGYADLAKNTPEVYAAPYLYLTASVSRPTDEVFPLPKSLRQAGIQTYYEAINTLQLGYIKSAQEKLLHAYSISSKCKEVRPSIVIYLGLTTFLLGESLDVFKSFIPTKIHIPSLITEMYDVDCKGYGVAAIFKPWESAIYTERARRTIIDIATAYTQCSLAELKEICGPCNFQKSLSSALSTINHEINGDIIYFSQPSMTANIEKEIDLIQKEILPLIEHQ